MAFLTDCPNCKKSFNVSSGSSKYLCDDCDGTNATKQAEKDRWAALTIEQKVEELREAFIELKNQRSISDMRF